MTRLSPSARRLAHSLLFLVVVALVATGCSEAVEDPDEIVLTFSAFANTGLNGVVDEWDREHPGIRVEFVEAADFNDHQNELFELLESGDRAKIPDVSIIEVDFTARMQARPELFEDLRAYGADAIADDYLAWRWSQGVAVDGSVVGVPTDVGGMAFAYRTDLFEQAGLPSDPELVGERIGDWESFIEFGKEYTNATGLPFTDDASLLFRVAVSQGSERFYGPDGGLIVEQNPHIRESWEIAAEAVHTGLVSSLTFAGEGWLEAMRSRDDETAFAALLAPAWMTTFIRNESPQTFGRWNVARAPGLKGNWGGSQLVVPANTEHPEIAYDLIQFILSPRSQQVVFETSGNFPSTPELYETDLLLELTDPFFNDAPLGDIYADSVVDRPAPVRGDHEQAIYKVFADALGSIRKGVDADEAWQQALVDIADLESG